MKIVSELQLKLIQLLADGNCHSGNRIGKQLNVSRTAIWKNIDQLEKEGVAIKRIPHQGYQLEKPLILLNEESIRQRLTQKNMPCPVNFHLFSTIDSTNRFLKELPASPSLEICCAEKQTQGRGRFGRNWVSPFGENIYFSSRWQLDCCLSSLSGLSLLVSLAIVRSLYEQSIKQDIAIKWPNDLLWQDKKLCGVLIEIVAETNGRAQVIIGIGLNVNTATHLQALPDRPWCSLYEMTGSQFDRNPLIGNLVYYLNDYLDKFLQFGFIHFKNQWQQLDYLYGKEITVAQPLGSLTGIACGVDELGQLGLKDKCGVIHYLSSGDTSLANY